MGNKCEKTKKHVTNKGTQPQLQTLQNNNNTKDCKQPENGPQLLKQPIVRSLTDGNIAQNPMPSHPTLSIDVEIIESVVIAMYWL
jgi:hypothetical protein